MTSERISIIIPARDAAATIDAALGSVAGDDRIAEVIVIDDASQDATAQLAARAGERLGLTVVVHRVTGQSIGPAAARNVGLAMARSDIIGFLDADDVWLTPVPAACVSEIEHGALAVIGRTANVGPASDGTAVAIGEPVHMYVPSAGLFRRRALDEIGGFTPSLRRGEDLDLFLRLEDAGVDVRRVDEVVLEYRHRPGTASSSPAGRHSGLLAALHQRIERSHIASTISVLMPTRNSAAFLEEALISIMQQQPAPSEVILIDGASTDRTRAIAAMFPGVTVIEQQGAGVHGAHNDGLARARSDVIVFCGSDDRVVPGSFAAHLAALRAHPAADLSVGLTRFFADSEGHAGTVREGVIDSVRRARCLEAVAVRRSAVERFGGFQEQLGPGADMEWNQRLVARGAVIVEVDQVVVEKRIHHGNTTYAADADAQSRLLGALRASIVRDRGAS